MSEENKGIPAAGNPPDGDDKGNELGAPSNPPIDSNSSVKKSGDHTPATGSPRWNEIYRGSKEKDKIIEEMTSNQVRLNKKIDSFIDNQEKKEVHSDLKEAESRMDLAHAESNNEAYSEAKKDLMRVQEESVKLNISNQNGAPVSKPITQSQIDEDLKIFRDYNPWYGKDEAKTDIANRINNEMMKDPEVHSSMDNSKMLSEVARKTNAEFEAMQNPNNGGLPYVSGYEGDGGRGFVDNSDISAKISALTDRQRKIAINTMPYEDKNKALEEYAKNLEV